MRQLTFAKARSSALPRRNIGLLRAGCLCTYRTSFSTRRNTPYPGVSTSIGFKTSLELAVLTRDSVLGLCS